MRNIGILGGSFNPIHKGHIGLAEAVLDQQLCDEVWLLVSPQNPLKHTHTLLPEEVRYQLALKAISPHVESIKVSRFEFQLPRPSYTYNTLCALAQANPNTQFSLIIGSDNWENFQVWKNWKELLLHYPLIVYPRDNFNEATFRQTLAAYSGKVLSATYLDCPRFPVSSTDIRLAVQRGSDISAFVPPSILDEVLRLYA